MKALSILLEIVAVLVAVTTGFLAIVGGFEPVVFRVLAAFCAGGLIGWIGYTWLTRLGKY